MWHQLPFCMKPNAAEFTQPKFCDSRPNARKMFICRSNFISSVSIFSRALCTKESWVDLTVDKEGIALLSLKRSPVNSLNRGFLQDINDNLDVIKKNECKGVVFTSVFPKIFSAGIDLNELSNPDPIRLRLFWSMLQDFSLKLYGLEQTTTVAINGYAAAGACVLSLLCDYRVMVNDVKCKIGLNDTAVGIVPRPWLCEIMQRVVGKRNAEIALVASTMYNAEEALKVNLIDETAIDKEDAIEKCKQLIRQFNNIPLKIRAQSKRQLRGSVLKYIEENREEDIEMFAKSILDSYTQQQISLFVQKLKGNKK